MTEKHKTRHLLNEAMLVLASQITLAATGLIVLKLSTNTFDKLHVAQIALAMTATSMLGQFITTPITLAISRHVARERDKGRLESYTRLAIRLFTLVIGIAFVGLVLGSWVGLHEAGKATEYWYLPTGLLIGCIIAFNNLATNNLSALRLRKVVLILTITESLFRISAISITHILSESILTYMLLLCLALIFQSVLALKGFRPNQRDATGIENEANALRKELWSFSKPLFIAAAPIWVYQSFDKWLIKYFSGEETLSGYVVMIQIGFLPMVLLYVFVRRLAYPFIVRLSDDSSYHQVRHISKVFFGGFSTFVFLVILLCDFYHENLVLFLTAEDYLIYSKGLVTYIISGYFFVCGQWHNFLLEVKKSTVHILTLQTVSAIAMIINFCSYAIIYGGSNYQYPLLISSMIYAILSAVTLHSAHQRG